MKCNSGFTLIELLITLAITSIVILSVGDFLVQNVQNYEIENERSTIQDEGAKAAIALEDASLSAERINACNITSEGHITSITFENEGGDITLNVVGGVMTRTVGSNSVDIANHIEFIEGIPLDDLTPLPINNITNVNNGFTNLNTNGVEYHINMRMDNQTYVLNQTVYFRNIE